jgi:UDP-N-acetylglucosamine 4,6-dehydratase
MNATRVKPGFSYDSGSNTDFLSVPQLQEMIKAEIGSVSAH